MSKVLTETQIEMNEIMELSPEDLARKQYELFSEHCIRILQIVIRDIEKKDFTSVIDATSLSNGDTSNGYDCNRYIDFGYENTEGEFEEMDIKMAVDLLDRLNRMVEEAEDEK